MRHEEGQLRPPASRAVRMLGGVATNSFFLGKDLGETVIDERVHSLAKLPVAGEKFLPPSGESSAACWSSAGASLQELEPGGLFQVSEVAPRVPVRHPEPGNRLLDGSQFIDEFEELGSAIAKFDIVVEDDPNLQFRLHDFLSILSVKSTATPMVYRTNGRTLLTWAC